MYKVTVVDFIALIHMKRKAATPKATSSKRRRVSTTQEVKFYDFPIINNVISTAGAIIPTLCGIPQGSNSSERVGRKVRIQSIALRGFSNLNDQGVAIFAGGNCRVVLYIDKQCNGATATVADIMRNASIGSFKNLNNEDRFTILADRNISIGAVTNAAHTSADVKYWSLFIKKEVEIHYSGITSSIADITSSNIGLLYFGDSANVICCSVGTCRIRYTD